MLYMIQYDFRHTKKNAFNLFDRWLILVLDLNLPC